MKVDEGVDDQKSSYGRGGRWNNAQGRLCSWEGRSLRSPNNARLLLRATSPTESGKAKKTMWRQMGTFRCEMACATRWRVTSRC